ncbi:MAG: glycosyltransferase family 4 protein [Muribaculaceae bacterium]|nr:glycosyltransferase family 4 protein [Muribaculaceae bacterium]
MKIILDNIIFSLQKAGGISGIWSKLIEELLTHPELNLHFLERSDAATNIFRKQLDIPDAQIIRYENLPRKFDRYMPVKIGEETPYIFHSPYYRFSVDKHARNVLTVHDFTYEEAKVHSLHARAIHTWQKSRAIKHADAICCVSKATHSKLLKRYSHLKADTRVIYNPIVCDAPARKTDVIPFLLYVGDRTPYKNFIMAAEAAGKSGMPLIIAGAPLTHDEKGSMTHFRLFYEERKYPDAKKLANLYSNAFALLYPSKNEGFGIPIIEAQSYGCPVIINSCDACQEVGADAVVTVQDADVKSLTAAINGLHDTKLRNTLIAKGFENIKRFNIRDIANQYISLYRQQV